MSKAATHLRALLDASITEFGDEAYNESFIHSVLEEFINEPGIEVTLWHGLDDPSYLILSPKYTYLEDHVGNMLELEAPTPEELLEKILEHAEAIQYVVTHYHAVKKAVDEAMESFWD